MIPAPLWTPILLDLVHHTHPTELPKVLTDTVANIQKDAKLEALLRVEKFVTSEIK
jgi:hypothetical protein